MQEQDTKISNIFKEKKREINRLSCKQNSKDIFFEENQKNNLISLLNKKRKNSNSKDKVQTKNKNLKTNLNIKNINNTNNNKNKNILGNIINIKEEEKDKNKKVFELSERTKSILEKITSKKSKEKEKENEIKKISKLYNVDNGFNNLFKARQNINKKKSPPKLSLRTMEIIQKINEKRKNRFDRERQNTTDKKYHTKSSFSALHLKYEELISEKRELRLPMQYKELFSAFNSMEHIINLNKIKGNNKLSTFENIKMGIESMTHHSFNLKMLKQILYIVPHFYIIKYVKKNEIKAFKLNDEEINKNYDLVIEVPFDYQKRMEKVYEKDFNFLNINYYKEDDKNFLASKTPLNISTLEKRKEIFRNIINLIVNNYHEAFLQKLNIKTKFNPLEQKTWYHKFDPDKECGDIPLYNLPPPPTPTSPFENTIMKNDLKKDIMNEEITMTDNTTNIENKEKEENKNEKEENKNEKKENSITNVTNNKYVSQNFLNKLRAKERANSVINEIQNYNLYHNSLKDMNKIYKEIILQTKTLLLTNKNIHKLKDVAEMVLNSSKIIKDNFSDSGKVMNTIKKICNKYNEIINVINHSFLGPVVVLVNKDKEIPEKIEL